MLPVLREIEQHLEPWSYRNQWKSLNRLFNDMWSDNFNLGSNFGRLDMYEDADKVHVEVELPGVKRDDIEITLEDGILHMQTKKVEETEKKDEKHNYYVRERVQGQWARSVQLPTAVDENNIEATFKDGILKIALEKQPDRKSRKIEVK